MSFKQSLVRKKKIMEALDIILDGKHVDNLQETFKEVVEDDDRVIEEETLITKKYIERENVLHATR